MLDSQYMFVFKHLTTLESGESDCCFAFSNPPPSPPPPPPPSPGLDIWRNDLIVE
jgi:hypothetical protein